MPLATVLLGWLPGMRLHLAVPAALFSARFGEGWEEGTWTVGSLLKPPSFYTRVSADGRWRGKSAGAWKAPGRLGEAWPPRPGSRRNKGLLKASKGSELFSAQFNSVSERNSWPRTGWWPWDPDGKWVGSPGPLLASSWNWQACGRKGAGSRQRASRWLGAGAIHAKTVRYRPGSSAPGPGKPSFALGSAVH